MRGRPHLPTLFWLLVGVFFGTWPIAQAQSDAEALSRRVAEAPSDRAAWEALAESISVESSMDAWRRLPPALQDSEAGWKAGARIAERSGDYPLGVRASESLIALAVGREDVELEIRTWDHLAHQHMRFGATEAARSAFREARNRALQAGRSTERIDGRLATLDSLMDRAVPEPDLATRIAALGRRTDLGRRKARDLRGLAFQCWQLGYWRLGLDAYRQILSLHSRLEISRGQVADDQNGAARLALELAMRSPPDERNALLAEALKWANSGLEGHRAGSGATEMYLRGHCVLASILSGLGRQNEAHAHFEEELRLVLAQRQHMEGEESVRVFHSERDHVFEDFALALASMGSPEALERSLRVGEIGRLGALRDVQRFRGRGGLSWTEEVLPLDRLRARAAKSGAVILVYMAGSFEGGVVAISSDGVIFKSLGPLERMDRVAKAFSRAALDLASNREAIDEAGRAVVEVFLAPLGTILEGRRRAIFVGTGRWSRLPFAALPWAEPKGADTSRLIQHCEVVYAPCLSSLLVAPPSSGFDGEVLAFGHSGVGGSSGKLREHFGVSLLLPLHRAAEEARSAAQAFDRGRSLVEKKATEAAWRQLAPASALIHVAAHAIVDDRERTRSVLVLEPELPGDDGLLSLTEIGATALKARLVVLSCCRTAIGRDLSGEGVRGLARAILSAGADTVVVSRSAVDDQIAPMFLRQLFLELRAGREFPAAMASAQRAMLGRRATSHPGLWGTFMMIGQGEMLGN